MKDKNGVTFGERGLPLERIERPIWADGSRDRLGAIWRRAQYRQWEYAEPALPKVIAKPKEG